MANACVKTHSSLKSEMCMFNQLVPLPDTQNTTNRINYLEVNVLKKEDHVYYVVC